MKKSLKEKSFLIIDLYSGRDEIKCELFNLKINENDGKYYGYCPPGCGININKLGASKTDNQVNDVMVIYTKRISPKSIERKVIAFSESATIFRKPQDGRALNRTTIIKGKEEVCPYMVVSNSIHNLLTFDIEFLINPLEYGNLYMFRKQRVFKGKYKELDEKLINYLEFYLSDNSALIYQDDIHTEDDAEVNAHEENLSSRRLSFITNQGCRMVNKDGRLAKKAIKAAQFKCEANEDHKTFITSIGYYMEGHHLIPCTCSNAQKFFDERGKNIDCEENIVSLCPTCHRKIHYGATHEKEAIIKLLYDKKIFNLKSSGLDISLEELKELYGC